MYMKWLMLFGKTFFIMTICISIIACGNNDSTNLSNSDKLKEDPQKINQQVNKTDFQSYSKDGITVQYPDGWTVHEGVMGTLVLFLSPFEDDNDKFQENANIVVDDLSQYDEDITLKDYTDASHGQISKLITGFNKISEGETKLGGHDAHQIVYTGMQGQFELKWRQVWTVVGKKAIVVSYTSTLDTFDHYNPIYDQIEESIKF